MNHLTIYAISCSTQPPFLIKSNLTSAVSSGCKEMPDTLPTLDEVMTNNITDNFAFDANNCNKHNSWVIAKEESFVTCT
jgi:hypothetical protein